MKRELAFWTGQADVAPVALFRIVYGLLTVNWFWQLLPNLTPFYADEGMLPRASQVTFFGAQFTLLNAAGETWQVAIFWFAVHVRYFLCSLNPCLLVGRRPRAEPDAGRSLRGSVPPRPSGTPSQLPVNAGPGSGAFRGRVAL